MNHLNFAIATAQKASQKLMEHYKESPPITRGTPKEVKSLFDEIADKIIIGEIEKEHPTHSILTEETGMIDKNSEYLWIIDPLDGTGNYVNSNPFWAISISLWKNNQPLLAVIDAPALNELYTAEIGQGAQITDTKTDKKTTAQVSETADLNKAYLTFCEGGVIERMYVLQTINDFYTHVKDMRKLGSAALECAWVGVGRADAYITHDISLWDIAAGILFVKEAGGELLKFNFSEYSYEELAKMKKIDIIASNKQLNLVANPDLIARGFCTRC